ncbi:ankyrin repeat-containing protein [Legionella birminghamensis]|uniref:Ankyrin repeat-containing protein n=1 Tax=Legionella birminghamensis TaxID=28083 RepID=A0A378ID04_9GAMM|nr:ankyrin repeat domain-containing protein [Legionella birminghamensis]KTC75484.1 ankyrin repeat-containing protein [Legionella birminghamensis]STX32710.1 ankyrin repeat-containing protein [Legionella birminghamensis]
MINFSELDAVLEASKEEGLQPFIEFLKSMETRKEQREGKKDKKELTKERLKEFAQQYYQTDAKENFTLLNYLIFKHHSEDLNLTPLIEYLLPYDNFITGKPIHFAFKHRKFDLIPTLLNHFIPFEKMHKEKVFGEGEGPAFRVIVEEHGQKNNPGGMRMIDSTDRSGYSLLARAVQARDRDSLLLLLQRKPNLDEPTLFKIANKSQVANAAIHQAVRDDWAEAVKILIDSGADPEISFNPARTTPFVIAVHYAKIDSLQVLLKVKSIAAGVDDLIQDPAGKTRDRPINILCQQLSKEKDKSRKDALLAGIAMLICRGAAVPENKVHQELISKYREQIADEITDYAKKSFKRSQVIIRQLHAQNSPWHNIFYPASSNPFRFLFSTPGNITKKMEDLVLQSTLKYRKKEQEGAIDPAKKDRRFISDEVKLAVFTRLFYEDRDRSCCTKRWATGFWNLGEGRFTSWDQVKFYANSPEGHNTRTQRVYQAIEGQQTGVHRGKPELGDDRFEEILNRIAKEEEEKERQTFMVSPS